MSRPEICFIDISANYYPICDMNSSKDLFEITLIFLIDWDISLEKIINFFEVFLFGFEYLKEKVII